MRQGKNLRIYNYHRQWPASSVSGSVQPSSFGQRANRRKEGLSGSLERHLAIWETPSSDFGRGTQGVLETSEVGRVLVSE